jgi:hypothetical protein
MVFAEGRNRLTVTVGLYGGSASIVYREKGVLRRSSYAAHYKHELMFMKVNKFFKRPGFHHCWGSWIVSFGRDFILEGSFIHTAVRCSSIENNNNSLFSRTRMFIHKRIVVFSFTILTDKYWHHLAP